MIVKIGDGRSLRIIGMKTDVYMSVLPRIGMSVCVQLRYSYFQTDNNLEHLFKPVSKFSNIANGPFYQATSVADFKVKHNENCHCIPAESKSMSCNIREGDDTLV